MQLKRLPLMGLCVRDLTGKGEAVQSPAAATASNLHNSHLSGKQQQQENTDSKLSCGMAPTASTAAQLARLGQGHSSRITQQTKLKGGNGAQRWYMGDVCTRSTGLPDGWSQDRLHLEPSNMREQMRRISLPEMCLHGAWRGGRCRAAT